MIIPYTNAYSSVETARSVCHINAQTGEVLFEKNSHDKMPMASTTKIMTLITALENSELDEMVTVKHEAVLTEGSSAYLKSGAKISMYDLLFGLMLNSGNDAANAIAYHISGSEENFAVLMNNTAKKIGVSETNFRNPSGLEEEEHYTTSYDLAKITAYCLKNDTFKEIVSSRTHTGRMILQDGTTEDVTYINHNRLLKELDGSIGVKTGFTKAAGRCLVSATEREGVSYIAVTLNDSDDWNTHKDLHTESFKNQKYKSIIKSGDVIKTLKSEYGSCRLIADNDFGAYTSQRGNIDFEVIINLPDSIGFPLNKGEKTGVLEILSDGVLIGSVDIVPDSDFYVEKPVNAKDSLRFTLITIMRNIL